MFTRLMESLAATEALSQVFSDASVLQAMLDFEVALARAEARCGVIPARRGGDHRLRSAGRMIRHFCCRGTRATLSARRDSGDSV